MNFLVTTFIYPLAAPLQLSRKLGFVLDNPRTEDEVSFIENLLIRARESGEDYGLPDSSEHDIVTVEGILFRLGSFLGEDHLYFREQFQRYGRHEALKFAASIWV